MKLHKPSENPITQGYSSSHRGYDFAGLNLPDDVRAGMDGEIIERVDQYTTSWTTTGTLTTRDYGNYIKVRHADGSLALFAHLRKGSSFEKGTKVKEGQTIARIGNTGNSTGPHLHSEYRNASNVNVEAEFEVEPMAVITQKELDEIRLRRDELFNETVALKETVNNLNSQIQNLQGQLSTASSDTSNCKTELLNLEKAKDSLQEQYNLILKEKDKFIQTDKEFNQLKQDYNLEKLRWKEQFETDNRTIAQLKNSSYKTVSTSELLKIVLARIFKIK